MKHYRLNKEKFANFLGWVFAFGMFIALLSMVFFGMFLTPEW